MSMHISVKELVKFSEDLLQQWNQIDGVRKCRGFSGKLFATLRARLEEKHINWRELCAEALEKMPSLPRGFYGLNPRTWRPDMQWFLRPNSVLNIVEGKYNNWKPDKVDPDRVKARGHE